MQTGMTQDLAAIREDAERLAKKLFKKKTKPQAKFVNQLLVCYLQAQDKDILVIHNPGGWGCTSIEHLIFWEASVVDGVKNTLNKLGYIWALWQYYRSGISSWDHLRDIPEQLRYFFTGKFFKAEILSAQLNFLCEHLPNLKILLLGVSQGAAFGNTVMKKIDQKQPVYSIELGMFFAHVKRRIITEQTLYLDNNGLVPDPVFNFNFKKSASAYITAPYRWLRYRLAGKPQKFTYCINVPGHEYRWDMPSVSKPIENFIIYKLGYKYKTNVEKSIL